MSDIMTYSHKYNRFLPRHTLLIGEHFHTHFQSQNNLQIKISSTSIQTYICSTERQNRLSLYLFNDRHCFFETNELN